MEMSTDNVDMVVGSGAGGPVNSRWNPTKEQISMLESLYRQGIRTPSAEQIQQITCTLKSYGHIEGKNVFYWFQNHKARQRQKQKQESIAYINRFLHNKQPSPHQPLFTPPCLNVVCGACYLPQSGLGFSPQYPTKVLLPAGGIKRMPRSNEDMDKIKAYACTGYEPVALTHEYNNFMMPTSERIQQGIMINKNGCTNSQETLPLFPLHPTGILQGKETTMCSIGSTSINTTHSSSSGTTSGTEEEGSGDKLFFDFFSGQDPCESD